LTCSQTVVNDLARTLDDEGDTAALQVAILSFLNALINYKAGEESLEFRLHLRYEFLMLGIQPLITRLRFLGISQLNKHIEIFEYVRVEDEKEFAGRLNIMERVDYTNVMNMTGLLQKKTAYTPAYVHLVSLLYHCLLLPVGDPNYEKYWRLMDRIIQQIVIQQDHGVDPDVSPLSVNVQKLVFNLLQEDEQRTLIKHVEDMKKGNYSISSLS
jgi:dishevelled associated activator of morphogenesis